jgi:Fe-S oxidoreductase
MPPWLEAVTPALVRDGMAPSGQVMDTIGGETDLFAQGKIKATMDVGLGEVAYHDSCYIGRHNGIFDAPRKVLSQLPGVKVTEPAMTGRKGRCCGAGGANLWYEVEEKDRMSNIRVRELAETGAKTIASNCPFCMTMFEDAKANVDETLKTQDLAEIVAMSLALHDARNGAGKEHIPPAGSPGGDAA